MQDIIDSLRKLLQWNDEKIVVKNEPNEALSFNLDNTIQTSSMTPDKVLKEEVKTNIYHKDVVSYNPDICIKDTEMIVVENNNKETQHLQDTIKDGEDIQNRFSECEKDKNVAENEPKDTLFPNIGNVSQTNAAKSNNITREKYNNSNDSDTNIKDTGIVLSENNNREILDPIDERNQLNNAERNNLDADETNEVYLDWSFDSIPARKEDENDSKPLKTFCDKSILCKSFHTDIGINHTGNERFSESEVKYKAVTDFNEVKILIENHLKSNRKNITRDLLQKDISHINKKIYILDKDKKNN